MACHRLQSRNDKYPACTIIMFINRKLVDYCLHNRDYIIECKNHLKMNLRFYEDLTAANEYILKECIKLKNYGTIKNYILRNGNIKAIITENSRPIKINHPDNFYDLFPNIYF